MIRASVFINLNGFFFKLVYEFGKIHLLFTLHVFFSRSSNSEQLRLGVKCNNSELCDMIRGLTLCQVQEPYRISALPKVNAMYY